MTASRKGLPRGARISAQEARVLAGRVRAALPGCSAYAVALALGIGHRTAQAVLAGEGIAASSARAIEARLDEMARLRAGATGKGSGA